MPKCSFCGRDYKNPRGLTLVLVDGSVKNLCSSKCRKNYELGRISKKVNWIRKSEESKEKKE